MIITRQELTTKGIQEFKETITFSQELFENNPIIVSVEPLIGYVKSEYLANLTILKLELKGNLVLRSTRTLKPVDYKLKVRDEIVLCHDKDLLDEESMIYFNEDSLNVDELFYSLLITSLPLKVVGKDEKDIYEGKGYEVITEEDYNNRKKGKNPQFSALEDFEFDD